MVSKGRAIAAGKVDSHSEELGFWGDVCVGMGVCLGVGVLVLCLVGGFKAGTKLVESPEL